MCSLISTKFSNTTHPEKPNCQSHSHGMRIFPSHPSLLDGVNERVEPIKWFLGDMCELTKH